MGMILLSLLCGAGISIGTTLVVGKLSISTLKVICQCCYNFSIIAGLNDKSLVLYHFSNDVI